MTEEYKKCTTEGRFTRPCELLWERSGDRKGIIVQEHLRFTPKKLDRVANTIYHKFLTLSDGGIMINFCPWCGEEINVDARKEVQTDKGKDIDEKN